MDLPTFAIRPTLRCFGVQGPGAPTWCGKPATHYRQARAWGMHSFLCAEHAEPGDVPLPSTVVFRRVRIMGHVDVAAISWTPDRAQNEAVRVMEDAIRAAGGLLDVYSVTSCTGRHTELAAPASPNGFTERAGG